MDFTMRFNGARDDTTRGKRITQTGCKFAWTDAATITLDPDGFDGRAQVITISGSTVASVRLTGSLTCNLGTSGGGGLDTWGMYKMHV